MDKISNRAEVARWVVENFDCRETDARQALAEQFDRHYYWQDVRLLTEEECGFFYITAPAAELRPAVGIRARYVIFRSSTDTLAVWDWDMMLKRARRRAKEIGKNIGLPAPSFHLKKHLRVLARQWKIDERALAAWRRELPWNCSIVSSDRFYLRAAAKALSEINGVEEPAYLLTPANEHAIDTVTLLVSRIVKPDLYGRPRAQFHFTIVAKDAPKNA